MKFQLATNFYPVSHMGYFWLITNNSLIQKYLDHVLEEDNFFFKQFEKTNVSTVW